MSTEDQLLKSEDGDKDNLSDKSSIGDQEYAATSVMAISSSSSSVDHLVSKTSDLTLHDQVSELQKKLIDLDEDFGAKRARFKELFMQKEDELAKERDSKRKLEEEVKQLQDELNETKSQVTIAELQKNDIDIERQRYQGDLIALRRKYDESIKEVIAKYDSEVHRLKHVNSKLEANINEVRETLSPSSGVSFDGPGTVFSTVGQHFKKSLARKINSTMTASNDSLHEIEDASKMKTPSTSKYAHEDAEMLRSLVVQLEEELVALKEKVRTSDDQLAALHNAQESLVKGNDALTVFLQGKEVEEVLTQLDDKLREAQSGLEAEKSSRADLEMYVAFANAQKTLLHDELEKAKFELRDLKENLILVRKQTVENDKRYDITSKLPHEVVLAKLAKLQDTISHSQDVTPEEALKLLVELHKLSNSNDESTGASSEPPPPAPCKDCDSRQTQIERLKEELHKSSQFRKEIEEESNTKAQGLQTQLNALEAQLGTYELLLHEVNTTSQQAMDNMESQLKRLQYERDSVQSKIEKLELENDNLKGKHVKNSLTLQNETISLPNDVMELQEQVLKLREDLISVQVGKEMVEGEFQFLRDQMKMIEEEKQTIEEGLNIEISSLRDALTENRHKFEALEEEKRKLEKAVSDVKTKLLASEAQSSKIYQSKKQSEETLKEKEAQYEGVMRDNQELQAKISTLRKELTNSEELQKDLISLSKSLQMELEAIRSPETEVRWQHPDDIGMCKTCKKGLHDTRDKHNCKHCGRIFCTDCVSRTVKRGNRNYNVCGFCHTLLAHDSAPYFSTEPPHSPD